MTTRFALPLLNRLQRKVLLIILALVVVPMLIAAGLAALWVSSFFETRLETWIRDAAHINQSWMEANQNNATLLGEVLAQDAGFRANLLGRKPGRLPGHLRHIASELGLDLVQVYDERRRLLYSSLPVTMNALWEPGQTQALVTITQRHRSLLTAVGITPIPARDPEFYIVLGNLLDKGFLDELTQLSGLKSRLYYLDGKHYHDAYSTPAKTLAGLPPAAWQQLLIHKRDWYSVDAEGGHFRGLYSPILDSRRRVEAIMFSGLERQRQGGFEELLTSRSKLFATISLLGIIIGSLIGLFLSRLILRPINSLRQGVMQLAGQNFNAKVIIHSNDELGDLAKAFNTMAARLREARDQQQQNFQRDKLAALGEVSASLAHEIRNPIGVINTASAMLEKNPNDEVRRTELIRMLREESSRVSSLIQDFLHLSRHRQPEFVVIDALAPLERALKSTLAGHDHIRVHRRFREGATPIMADPGLLQQAWVNLIANAVQAIGDGPGQLWLTSSQERDNVVLTLEDSGPGIPTELIPRVFEPLFTTRDHGTGLGLAIAHTLIEANGGVLELLPPGKHGACFVMRFPTHKDAQ